jgi:hypothetical protein
MKKIFLGALVAFALIATALINAGPIEQDGGWDSSSDKGSYDHTTSK